MHSPCLIRCIVQGLLLAAIMAAEAPAAETAGHVVVLRNGNVLLGEVRQAGAYYRIEQSGSTLQVPADQVETVCQSLNEAYETRRRRRVGSSVDSNLELARWCLRHDLLDQAAREILDARTKDPRHPALRLLDLQLQQQLEVVAAKANAAPRPAPAPTTASSGIALASHVEPLAAPDELFTPSVAAQAEFVRSIQPMLLHGCATGGCHQSGSQRQLQLDRWALEGNGNPTLIRRNLHSVLAHIDRDDPPSSPLMRWARQAHGVPGARPSTPLGPFQAALLLEWLNACCGIEPEPLPVSELAPPADDYSGQVDQARAPADGSPSMPAAQSRRVPRSASALQPRDPFDPAVFNRLHAAEPADRARATAGVEIAAPTGDQQPPSQGTVAGAQAVSSRQSTADEAAVLKTPAASESSAAPGTD